MINRRDLLISSAAGLVVASLPSRAQHDHHAHQGHDMDHDHSHHAPDTVKKQKSARTQEAPTTKKIPFVNTEKSARLSVLLKISSLKNQFHPEKRFVKYN